jgi:hypothetical protein
MASPLVLATESTPLSPTTEEGSRLTKERGPPPEDPYCPIKGMYRLLDLIMEQGNSGLGNWALRFG